MLPDAIPNVWIYPHLPGAPGRYFTVVEQPVAVRDLAEELGLTPGAVFQKIGAGKILGTFKQRNVTFVPASTAQEIRDWWQGGESRNRTWPTFGAAVDQGAEEP